MAKITWNTSAILDVKDIYEYIASDSKKYAIITIRGIRGIRGIRNVVKVLRTNPHAGKVVDEFKKDTIRELVYSHYRIIYNVADESHIRILIVHHGARSIPKRKLKY